MERTDFVGSLFKRTEQVVFSSDKKSFVRQKQLARLKAGGIRSKVADSGREKSTNQKSHVHGENNRDKDGQKAQE